MIVLLAVLFIIKSVAGHELKPIICDGVVFDNKYYERQMLFGTLNFPRSLVMHMFSGLIFFSHIVKEGNKTDFMIRVCDVDKRTCKDLKEVVGGYTVAYDRVHHDVFFGGRNGIYKFNTTTLSANLVAAPGIQISHILIHNHLYYIEGSTKNIWEYKNASYRIVKHFQNVQLENFFISRHYYVYFSNKTALYKCNSINKPPHMIFNIANIRQMIQQHKSNKVYITTSDGIYYVHDKKTNDTKVKKVADIGPVFGITFRNTTQSQYEPQQIIYSDINTIYKLTPSKQNSLCLREKKREFVYKTRQMMNSTKYKLRMSDWNKFGFGYIKNPIIRRTQRMMFVKALR